MFIPDHLELYEVLPKAFYEEWYPIRGEGLWLMFDDRLLLTYHEMRKVYGPANLNTWYWGGTTQYRGWRPFDSIVGADFSQHKFGRAFDIVFRDYSAEVIRQSILEAPFAKMFKFISAIEMDVSWLHIDIGNRAGVVADGTSTFIRGEIIKVYP